MDSPGPVKIAAILRKELVGSGSTLAPGLCADERLTRLSGGHLRSLVQVAGMLASTRGQAGGTPITLDDAAEALRLHLSDAHNLDQKGPSRVHWIGRRSPACPALDRAGPHRAAAGGKRDERTRSCCHPGHSGRIRVRGRSRRLSIALTPHLRAIMHLNTIQLHNLGPFRGTTPILTCAPVGTTAILGRNGSGKTTVANAVRWC